MLAIVLVRLAVIVRRPRSEFGLLLGSNFCLAPPESQLDNSGARLVFQLVALLLFCPTASSWPVSSSGLYNGQKTVE